MRFFSVVACVVSMGLCHAGSTEACTVHHSKKGRCFRSEGRKAETPGVMGRVAMGGATLNGTGEPVLVKAEDTFTQMTSRALFGMDFKDGVFTIQRDGDYRARFFAKIRAKGAKEGDSVVLGVFVGEEEKARLVLPFSVDSKSLEYPGKFIGQERKALSLKAGDKVFLKVISVNLSEGASAYFVGEDNQGNNLVVGLFFHSIRKETLR